MTMATLKTYQLGQVLAGHTNVVCAVDVGPDFLVTASKDKTAIFWKLQKNGKYGDGVKMTGHKKRLTAVCVIPASNAYEKGLIVTGGLDNFLCVYDPGTSDPKFTLDSHKIGVNCLRTSCAQKDAFLSCSSDTTARLCHISEADTTETIYEGHNCPVLCVADLPSSYVVTGGKDSTAIIYTREGTIMHILREHEGSVSDICLISDDEFLTASYDASIKLWNVDFGECLGNFYGHSNCIRSIRAINNGMSSVSSGDDRTVRVWTKGELDQTITFPDKTVYAVKILPNGDLVCCSTTNVVRVFTRCRERLADAKSRMKFDEAVVESEKTLVPHLKNVSDVNKFHPGDELKYINGEIKLVKEGPREKAYSWSAKERRWNLVNASASAMGMRNVWFEGVQYDYLFYVDLKNGKPLLRLTFNKGDDPYVTAQNFINENKLDQICLDRLSDFIIKNTSGNHHINATTELYNTATRSYRYAGGSDVTIKMSSKFELPPILSQRFYRKMIKFDFEAVRFQLLEYNSAEAENKENVSVEEVENCMKLTNGYFNQAIEAGALDTLFKLLRWPEYFLPPVLNILQLIVGRKPFNSIICTEEICDEVLAHLDPISSRQTNQRSAYRFAANMLYHSHGRFVAMKFKNRVILTILENLEIQISDRITQIAMGTYFSNLAVFLNSEYNLEQRQNILRAMCIAESKFTDREARFRTLIAIGTLLSDAKETERAYMIEIVCEFDNILKSIIELPPKPVNQIECPMDEILREICMIISSRRI